MKRRDFLKGFFASPAVVLPASAKATKPRFQAGDLVNYAGPIPHPQSFIGAKGVAYVHDGVVFLRPHSYRDPYEAYSSEHLKLFEGLPGNRVDNPSMRHRLIREAGRIGLRYPEDIAK